MGASGEVFKDAEAWESEAVAVGAEVEDYGDDVWFGACGFGWWSEVRQVGGLAGRLCFDVGGHGREGGVR